MTNDEIFVIANNSVQSDMLAIEDAVNDCYEQHKAVWEKWDKGEISDSEYYSKSPYGYECWSCSYCGKWTGNFKYR